MTEFIVRRLLCSRVTFFVSLLVFLRVFFGFSFLVPRLRRPTRSRSIRCRPLACSPSRLLKCTQQSTSVSPRPSRPSTSPPSDGNC